MGTHAYGCRVIQRLLEYCSRDQNACILDEVHQSTPLMVFDQYGMYLYVYVCMMYVCMLYVCTHL
jgi:hypothetical protein